jgi:hypothetical protein
VGLALGIGIAMPFRFSVLSSLFGAGTAGGTLLGASETDGLAVDFTAATPDLLIRDAASTLNYSGTPFLNDGGKLTFSRTSLATVVDDDGLVKWAPHNLAVRSAEFSDASWTKTGASVTTGSSDPAGGTNAFTLEATATGNSFLLQSILVTQNVVYTSSIFAKAGNTNFVALTLDNTLFGGPHAVFNLSNGTIDTAPSGATALIESIGGGWYRCSLTDTPNNTVSVGAVIVTPSRTGAARLQGVTGDTVLVWGAHLYRSDLGGMQANGTAYPTYNPTVGAAYYGPRIDHDPVTLAKKGLLMEEARTNNLLHSAGFDDILWIKTAASITANNTAAPDGTTTADKLIDTAADTAHFLAQNVTLVENTTYTYSCFLKAGERSWGRLALTDRAGTIFRVWFDLSSGTKGTDQTTGSTGTITSVGDGWYRCTMTVASGTGATTNGSPSILVTNADNTTTYLGDGTSGIYLWGAQLEAGAFPTSYIPTTTASVTRAVDANTAAVTLFPYSATEGTLFAEFTPFNVGAARRAVEMNDTTANERVTLGSNSTPNGLWTVIDGGASQAAIATGTPAANTTIKMAARWKANDFALSVNGAAASTDTSGTLPTMTTLRIGSGVSNAEPINGHIRKVVYLPRVMSDAELATRSA